MFRTRNDEAHRQQMRACLESADLIIAISQSTAEDLQGYYGTTPDKIRVVPLACSQHFRKLDAPIPIRPFLLYVGRRAHYKNFNRLLAAYAQWPMRTEFGLTVVGRAWKPDELRTMARLNISNSVQLLEHVDDEQLNSLYNQATAFIHPSFYEGFGIPLLEAMTCGCPVVASRITTALEVAGKCPYYFDPNNTEELIAALTAAATNGRTAPNVALGLERAAKFSWEKTAKMSLSVYRELS
jgi:glycosyltransferase involved in cell wall biosynthesis